MWEEDRNAHLFTRANLSRAQVIIDMLANYDLQVTLPKDIPTLHAMATRNFTQPDNVFVSSSICEHVLECKTAPEEWPARTDHMPVITMLDMGPGRHEESPKPNFKAADWDKVQKEMSKKLKSLSSADNISNKDGFYRRLNILT